MIDVVFSDDEKELIKIATRDVLDDKKLNRNEHDIISLIKLAISDGCEMIPYCLWSASDLISTHEGIVKLYIIGFI